MARQTTFSAQERAIAKKLGVTCAGLSLLTRSYKSTLVVAGGVACDALARKGLVTNTGEMTAEGRRLVDEARRLGW